MTNDAPVLARTERLLYNEWKQNGRHITEYACELIGTAFLVFCVVGVVAVMFGAHSPVPHRVPNPTLRLFLAGLMIGSSGALVAVSPLGRLSGGHLNPAVSLGFYMLGKMHLRDTAFYAASQFGGAAFGAAIAGPIFAGVGLGTHSAALVPNHHAGTWGVFLAEAGTTYVLTYVIFTCVSRRPLMAWTPLIVTLFAGILVALDGHYSGAGMNPARWIGPAAITHEWGYWAAYAFAPFVGTVLAVVVRMAGIVSHPLPHTAKLFHDATYRSIFKLDTAHSQVPKKVRDTHARIQRAESIAIDP